MNKKEKLLFIDRDGTIVKEPQDNYQIDSLEKLEFKEGVIVNLFKICSQLDYLLVMVSNQDGLGTESFPRSTFLPPQKKILTLLKNEGIKFKEILIDDSFPQDNKETRKPKTGLVRKYMVDGKYDLENSYMIGDRKSDLLFARNIGCQAIWMQKPTLNNKRILNKEKLAEICPLITEQWEGVWKFLLTQGTRRSTINRKTQETDVYCSINLDGRGKYEIDTGLKFFDHMLEQFSFHSGFDLNLKVKGDLWVDEHHTIEDTAITLGEVFKKAVGNKLGINRYGFLLPMDDSISEVAVDVSQRPWLNWKVKFTRAKIGDVPTEMFKHFFQSFSVSAGLNVYIKSEGKNDHHQIEAVFKGFARALKQAVEKTDNKKNLPSSKGVI